MGNLVLAPSEAVSQGLALVDDEVAKVRDALKTILGAEPLILEAARLEIESELGALKAQHAKVTFLRDALAKMQAESEPSG